MFPQAGHPAALSARSSNAGDVVDYSSNPVLNMDDRENTDISEIGGIISRQSSSGNLRTTKQVTLPTVRRKDQTRDAWSEVNGSMASPYSISARSNARVETVSDDNDSEDYSDSSDSEVEDRRVPEQLRMEFLECLMKKEYHVALKLCRMILIYEPNNVEANQFLSLIQEKIELDERPESEDEETEDHGEGDETGKSDDDEEKSDDDDSESDDSSDDSDSDVEESDDEETDDEQETLVRAILKSRLENTHSL